MFLVISCGLSKNEIQRQIKISFQEKLDAEYSKYDMIVNNVILVKTGPNKYDGMVNLSLGEKKHDVSITVTADNDSFMWEVKPLAFAFLLQYELEEWSNEWSNIFD
jgi:hypothetical protein